MRQGIRRRRDDDNEVFLDMPPNKKALVEMLENLCISVSNNARSSDEASATGHKDDRLPTVSTFLSASGPRQFLYPHQNRCNLYASYM